MGFLAPAIPAIAGALGAFGASKLSGSGLSNDEKQGNNLLNYNAQAATPLSQGATTAGNTALGTGMNFLNQFNNMAGKSGNWFQSLLSGNQANTTAVLAPDINRIKDQNQQTLTAASTLAPRGGGRGSMLFDLPFKTTSETGGLYNGARPAAAANLANLAGEYGSIGVGAGGLGKGLLDTGVSALNAGTNAASWLDSLAGQQKQFQYGTGKDLGAGLYGIANKIDWSKFPGLGGGGDK